MPTIEEYAKQPLEQRLKRLERTPDDVADAIKGQPEATLSRRPDAKNWAAKECICHLRDVEDYSAMRFDMILAMEEPRFPSFDADRWAEDRQYLRNDAVAALASFRKRRNESLEFLGKLTPAQWQRAGIHPRRGRMTFDDLVAFVAGHDDNHVDQLKRALEGKA